MQAPAPRIAKVAELGGGVGGCSAVAIPLPDRAFIRRAETGSAVELALLSREVDLAAGSMPLLRTAGWVDLLLERISCA